MSDPVTNVEIEDVLSSIRKLVSAEDRPARSEADDKRAAPEKLVLTPSLRVDQDAPDAHSASDPESDPESDVADEAPQKGADEESAIAAPAQDFREAEEQGSTSDHAAQAQEPAEAATFSHAPQREGPAESTFTRAAIFRKAADTNDDEWEPDEATSDVKASMSEALPWQDVTDRDDEGGSDAAVEPPASHEASSHEPSTQEGLEAYTPDPEQTEAWQAAETVDVAEEMEFEAADAPGGTGGSENAFHADEDIFADDEAVLDEDALRDLVAEIVRQELQGALGERITRNVRKLVRREIQRALAAQELQ